MWKQSVTWQQSPFLRVALGLISGGLLYLSYPVTLPGWIPLFTLFALMVTPSRKKILWSLLFWSFTLSTGWQIFSASDTAIIPPAKETTTDLLIIKDLKHDSLKNRWKGTCKFGNASTDTLTYFWLPFRFTDFIDLKPGDTLVGDFQLQVPEPPEVPGSFDFQAFLKHRNIPYCTYITKRELDEIIPSQHHSIGSAVRQWKALQKSRLQYHLDSNSSALLMAVLFGDSQHLSHDVREQFARAGMAHILAVSGMHVGILILIVRGFMGPFVRFFGRKKELVQFPVLLCAVWSYVAICDFAPSATRAALMATFYFLGKALSGKNNGMNALAMSAIILYCFDPFMILDIGAQLSFGALTGILLTYNFFETLLFQYLPIPHHFSRLIAMAFAAQLGVAPFLLFHFGTLPLYFWLFSIPAAYFAFVLFAGGWFLILSDAILPKIADFWASLLEWIISTSVKGLMDLGDSSLPVLSIPYFPVEFLILSIIALSILISCAYCQDKKRLWERFKYLFIVIILWQFAYQWDLQRNHQFRFEWEEQKVLVVKKENQAHILSKAALKPEFQKEMLHLQVAAPIHQLYFYENHQFLKKSGQKWNVSTR